MALNDKENKIKETMAIIPSTGVNVEYANVLRWTIDKNGYVTPDIIRYGSEENRKENPDQHLPPIGVGFCLPKSVQKRIWDFIGKELYPYLELNIHISEICKNAKYDSPGEVKQVQEGIDALYDKMGLEKPS